MWIRPFYHEPLKHLYRAVTDAAYRELCTVRSRYGRVEGKREMSIRAHGWTLRIPDAPSFLSAYQAIFYEKIYDFASTSARPYILDVGANIGLSALFFKERFPQSKVVAFEADPTIRRYLSENLEQNSAKDVEIVQKAIWSSEGVVDFHPDGADAGRIAPSDAAQRVRVESTRLIHWLQAEPVDFLKLDIEGAEVEVIRDCAALLQNVKNMYIEYHSLVSAPQRLGEMLKVCEDAGFRITLDSVNRLRKPFILNPEYAGMDVQLHVFCRRV
jgi:FkbM family methyltransferase